MAYPNCTSTDVLNLVTAVLNKSSLPNNYAIQATQAFNRAFSDLRIALCRKGYAVADLDNWDDAPTYVIQLAMFHLLNLCSALRQYPELKAAASDPTQMLVESGFLIEGGISTAPQRNESPIGGVADGCSIAIAVGNREYDRMVRGGRDDFSSYGDWGGPWVG